MVSTLFKLQIQNMKPELALSILLKYSNNIDLVETVEDKKRLISIFQAYDTTWAGKITENSLNVPASNLNQVFELLKKISKVFELETIDDSFKFNQSLNELAEVFNQFHKEIVDEAKHYYPDIDPNIKVEEEEVPNSIGAMDEECILHKLLQGLKKVSHSDNSIWMFMRELWVKFIEGLVNKLACVNGKKWRDAGIKQFVKEIFYKKDMIFNEEQKERMGVCMEKVLTSQTTKQVQLKKLEYRDSSILQNPLNSKNEVKDSRTWTVSMNGLDKWGMKQMGL